VHSGIDVYHLISIRKRDVIKNIALSFPEKSKKEVGFIAKNTYKTFIKVFVDMFLLDAEIEKLLI